MMCVNPVFVKKSGLHVKCGKCLACKERSQKEWAVRLAIELKSCQTAYFVTFTYNDDYIVKINNLLQTSDFQPFLKDLKNFLIRGMPNYYKGKKVPIRYLKLENFKYFVVGEYGTKNLRAHWHGLFFNLPYSPDELSHVFNFLWSYNKSDKKTVPERETKGFLHFGTVTPASIDYCTNYLLKNDKKDSIRLISKGIGLSYINDRSLKYHSKKMDDNITVNHNNYVLPRYLKEKIFTSDQRKEIGEKKRDYGINQVMEKPELIMNKYEYLKNKVKFKLNKK